MIFVLDASVSASWGLEDEKSDYAESVLLRLRNDTAVVPQIWWYEIRNLMLVCERRKRISATEMTRFLGNLAIYPIKIDASRDERTILGLARQYRLTFYDAAYLALAQREQFPLATLDKALQQAATAAGVELL